MISPDWATLQKQHGKNLPHWDCENAVYHVCFRLADSIPQAKRVRWFRERTLIIESAAFRNGKLTKEEQKRLQYLFSEKIEKCLDAGLGKCYLRRPDIAETVQCGLHYFDGQRYYLHAWSIMPNHVHTIVEPSAGHSLSRIVHSWKSFTANRINRQLGRSGQLWQHEPFDHIIRSEHEYWEQLEYVWSNPEKSWSYQLPEVEKGVAVMRIGLPGLPVVGNILFPVRSALLKRQKDLTNSCVLQALTCGPTP